VTLFGVCDFALPREIAHKPFPGFSFFWAKSMHVFKRIWYEIGNFPRECEIPYFLSPFFELIAVLVEGLI